MALCKECSESCLICGGPCGKKCSVCGTELSNPANGVCKKCSKEKNLCEYCGKPIDSVMTNYRIFYFALGFTQWYDFQAVSDDAAREEAKKFARANKVAIEILMDRDKPVDLHLRFDPSKEAAETWPLHPTVDLK